MAEILRFRPVLFGPLERPTDVLYALEETSGQAYFRALDFPWLLEVPLEDVTVADLSSPYNGCYRGKTFPVTILPTHEVRGRTPVEAFERMLAVLRRVKGRGAAALERTA